MRDQLLRIPCPGLLLRISLLFAAALPFACGGPPANYPDTSAVVQAQAEWCKSLANLLGKGDKWEDMSECKGAYPTASAEYLKWMTKCFSERLGDNDANALDYGQVVAECTDEIAVRMPGDGPNAGKVLEARCRWMERCHETPLEECKAGVFKLEAAQRAIFTTTYNGAALNDIAGCLGSAACNDDEEVGLSACYKEPMEKLLWFPN